MEMYSYVDETYINILLSIYIHMYVHILLNVFYKFKKCEDNNFPDRMPTYLGHFNFHIINALYETDR